MSSDPTADVQTSYTQFPPNTPAQPFVPANYQSGFYAPNMSQQPVIMVAHPQPYPQLYPNPQQASAPQTIPQTTPSQSVYYNPSAHSAQPAQAAYYIPAPTPDSERLIPRDEVLIPDDIVKRNFQVNISQWFNEAWTLYLQNWPAYSLFTVLLLLLSCIPYAGMVFVAALCPGYFIAGVNSIRPTNTIGFQGRFLFHSFYYFFPLLVMNFLISLAVAFGLLFLIFPGIYLAVTLSFAQYIYMEYRSTHQFTIMQCLSASRRLLSKQFCAVFVFLLATGLVAALGLCVFVVGGLVSIPVASLMYVFAFRDMVGLNNRKVKEDSGCVCC